MQRSIISGLNNNSIDSDDLNNLLEGHEVIKIDSRPQFTRNMQDLSITINNQNTMTVNPGSFKELISNWYMPQHINPLPPSSLRRGSKYSLDKLGSLCNCINIPRLSSLDW